MVQSVTLRLLSIAMNRCGGEQILNCESKNGKKKFHDHVCKKAILSLSYLWLIGSNLAFCTAMMEIRYRVSNWQSSKK